MEQQKELKYMNMVINENLRLYPPLQVYHEELIHKILQPYPEKFIPERFQNEKRDNHAWLSFGGGSRLCLGVNFSLMEQRITLCALLRKYEVSLPADSTHKDKLQIASESSGTMGPHPIPLIFKRRTD
ncbi:cytochrome P450 [Glomus cerebriforme]|uniref:Cytochrome P450 n=1 Tax=Glomus cerebriforme TaxID=658196 RepID=A0A397SBA9_9GLOM|nr:cytochrome P450 [Glomus cerebriforme]